MIRGVAVEGGSRPRRGVPRGYSEGSFDGDAARSPAGGGVAAERTIRDRRPRLGSDDPPPPPRNIHATPTAVLRHVSTESPRGYVAPAAALRPASTESPRGAQRRRRNPVSPAGMPQNFAQLSLVDGAEHGRPDSARFKNFTAPVRTIDAVLEERGGACPSLVKLDVEGMEDAALRGAARTIRRCRPSLYVENNVYPDASVARPRLFWSSTPRRRRLGRSASPAAASPRRAANDLRPAYDVAATRLGRPRPRRRRDAPRMICVDDLRPQVAARHCPPESYVAFHHVFTYAAGFGKPTSYDASAPCAVVDPQTFQLAAAASPRPPLGLSSSRPRRDGARLEAPWFPRRWLLARDLDKQFSRNVLCIAPWAAERLAALADDDHVYLELVPGYEAAADAAFGRAAVARLTRPVDEAALYPYRGIGWAGVAG